MESPHRVLVIINPASGQDKPLLGPMNSEFHPAGVEWDVRITNGPGDAERFAREAAESGEWDMVAVCGGDGTVNEAIAGLVDMDIPLAVLPGGTGNGVSGELGLPGDVGTAAHLIVSDHEVHSYDVGFIGEHALFLRAVLGDLARVDENADRELKNRLGGAAYVLSALHAIKNPEPATYRITSGSEVLEQKAVAGVVLNGSGVGRSSLKLADGVSMDDGELDVLLFTGERRNVSGAAEAVTYALGQGTLPNLPRASGQHLRIESDPPVPVRVDGEEAGMTPIDITVKPRSVRVVVPTKPVRQAMQAAATPG